MNLLQKLLASAKVGDGLDFGILENIILKNVNNETQLRDGQEVQRNCHMRFQRYNAKGVVYQDSQFSYFNIDIDREKRPVEKFLVQLEQLTEIALAIDPKCADKFGTESFKVLKDHDNIEKQCRSKEAPKFQNKISDVFVKCVTPYLESEPKLRLKIVTNWDGKYMGLPDSVPMIESMDIPTKDSILKVSHTEILNHKKTDTSAPTAEATPDSNSEKPKQNAVLADL